MSPPWHEYGVRRSDTLGTLKLVLLGSASARPLLLLQFEQPLKLVLLLHYGSCSLLLQFLLLSTAAAQFLLKLPHLLASC